eukprot:GEMP01029936.1.p1 GENE.GEMP01029936.1~~GEMP01029936.1.p1  ORF type:complete len:496 (+),score=118.97 GEMP01029936.1:156-1643(+)
MRRRQGVQRQTKLMAPRNGLRPPAAPPCYAGMGVRGSLAKYLAEFEDVNYAVDMRFQPECRRDTHLKRSWRKIWLYAQDVGAFDDALARVFEVDASLPWFLLTATSFATAGLVTTWHGVRKTLAAPWRWSSLVPLSAGWLLLYIGRYAPRFLFSTCHVLLRRREALAAIDAHAELWNEIFSSLRWIRGVEAAERAYSRTNGTRCMGLRNAVFVELTNILKSSGGKCECAGQQPPTLATLRNLCHATWSVQADHLRAVEPTGGFAKCVELCRSSKNAIRLARERDERKPVGMPQLALPRASEAASELLDALAILRTSTSALALESVQIHIRRADRALTAAKSGTKATNPSETQRNAPKLPQADCEPVSHQVEVAPAEGVSVRKSDEWELLAAIGSPDIEKKRETDDDWPAQIRGRVNMDLNELKSALALRAIDLPEPTLRVLPGVAHEPPEVEELKETSREEAEEQRPVLDIGLARSLFADLASATPCINEEVLEG